jgi:hypothetical protein
VPASSRLYVLLAREAPTGVILKRGPGKWTQLILWRTDNDAFELGQWFKGRVWETVCDLSPNGKLLLYCVSKVNSFTLQDKEYTHTWTAVSKPPYFTALALWPNGDANEPGGGVFLDNNTVKLNFSAPHHNEFRPRGLKIIRDVPKTRLPFSDRRFEESGWLIEQEGLWEYPYGCVRPQIWRKDSAVGDLSLIHRTDGLRYRHYLVRDNSTGIEMPMKETGWIDWEQNGRLVFNRGHHLCTVNRFDELNSPEVIADFSTQSFYELQAPAWARHW